MEGRLDIWRTQTGAHIRVTDQSSRISFLEIDMDAVAFTNALLNLAEQPCTFELRGAEDVGKRREHKEVLVSVVGRPHVYEAEAREAYAHEVLSVFECDGWLPRYMDYWNPHNLTQDNTHARVNFTRLVADASD